MRSILRKPPLGATIDATDPLARNLRACFLLNEGGGIVVHDLIGASDGKITDTAVVSWASESSAAGHAIGQTAQSGPFLSSVASASATRGVTFGNTIAIGTSCTYEVWMINRGSDSSGSVVSQNNTRGFFTDNSGGGFKIDVVNAAGGAIPSTTVLSHNVLYHIVAACDNVTHAYYVNGVLDSNPAGTHGSIAIDTIFNDTSSDTFVGSIYLLRLWHNRVLNAAEVFDLYTNPFRMFSSPIAVRRSRVFAVASAVVNYSMPAAVGAFTLLGKNASLLLAAKAAAHVGTFVVAGQTAAFHVTRGMPAGVGVFVLSGQSAVLTKAVVPLAADVGIFAVAGQSASFNVALHLTASSGAFIVSGNNVVIVAQQSLMPTAVGLIFNSLLGEF